MLALLPEPKKFESERPIELEIYEEIGEFLDILFDNIKDTEIRSQIELYLNGNFITEQNSKGDNICTLKLFINLNILSKKYAIVQ